MKVFVIDVAKCNGCYGCQLACKDEHVGNDWLPYAGPQPDTGHFWLKVRETVHGQVPRVRLEYLPIPCMHCDNPVCITAGDKTVYKREDGLVIIDPVLAKGRKDLISVCPYGAVYWNETLEIPQKCTGCAHLVDEDRLPHCVDFCATGALRFGEEEEFADVIALAETLCPENGQNPRVYYLNLPKLFIAGGVWDPKADEIIEGAAITLTNAATKKELVTQSDNFGDFWFRKLAPGIYELQIQAEGFRDYARQNIELDQSINIGDIPLVK